MIFAIMDAGINYSLFEAFDVICNISVPLGPDVK